MAGQGSAVPLYLPSDLPPLVRSDVERLAPEQQSLFLEEYRRKSKSNYEAYVLWITLAGHYLYLGRWVPTLLMWTTFTVFTIGLAWWLIDTFGIPGTDFYFPYRMARGLVWATFIILGVGLVWWLVDAFRIPGMVRKYNQELATELLRTIKT